ncbi:MAG: peptidylprolyl isomerase [Bacteroidota bacterium]|nr:peptidylprolyl isomerase [Bacteroidota bacterium]
MNSKKSIFVLLFFISFFANAQKPETVLFTIADETIMLSEFEYIYQKNNKNDENYYSKESLNEYLDLFINFRLKVKEAKTLGLDTVQSFKKEFETYREQLTKPYMSDKKTIEKLKKEAFERMNWEIKASHILIIVKEDAPPEEVQKAKEKIMSIYKSATNGENFEELAKEHSEDPSVKRNKGSLGYFSAFHLIYKFESAAFNTAVNNVSEPFRTQFGFHILKVTDKRPYQGKIKVSQIFLQVPEDADTVIENNIKKKIDNIYKELNKSKDFEKFVTNYSDDKRSKRNDGVLPPFTSFSYSIPAEFKEVAFTLENDGDFSKPFRTKVGWHIIKRLELEMLKPYEEMEDFITRKVKRDSRSILAKDQLITNLKDNFRFKERSRRLKIFSDILDSTLFEGKWEIPKNAELDKWLIKIEKEKYTQKDFAEYIQLKHKKVRFSNIPYSIEKYFELYVEETILAYSEEHLEENYPEFKNLVNEYLDGMLLFEITDKKVWSKAMSDTIGQKDFYQDRKDNYQWKKRVQATIYICKNENIAKKVKSMLKDQKLSTAKIVDILNEKDPLNITYSIGKYEEGENELLEPYFGKKDVFVVKDTEKDTWRVLDMQEYFKEEIKKYENIKGIVIADYQNYLEKKWIKSLKQKYPLKVNEEVLTSIIKKK